MNFKELKSAFDFEEEVKEKTNKMEAEVFISVIAMLLGEWCRENNEDVIEITQTLLNAVVGVNKEYGSY